MRCGDGRIGGVEGRKERIEVREEEGMKWKKRRGEEVVGKTQYNRLVIGRSVCRKENNRCNKGEGGRDEESLFASVQVRPTLTQKSRKMLHSHVNSLVHHTTTHLCTNLPHLHTQHRSTSETNPQTTECLTPCKSTDNSVSTACVSKASLNKVNLLNSDTERETKFKKRQQFSTTLGV